jgi:hypothetical protein
MRERNTMRLQTIDERAARADESARDAITDDEYAAMLARAFTPRAERRDVFHGSTLGAFLASL